MEDDPEKRIADLEHQLAEARAGANPKRDRRERRMRVREEAGIGRAQWQVERIVAITLVVLCIAGLTLCFVGDGALMWIGVALLVGAAVALVTLSKVRSRSIEKVRWQDGTITFRTVEPGNVGESGQRVDCEIELSPQQSFTRVYTTVGPLDAERIVVGATMRCLIDRMETLIALRAFPYAQPGAALPSGRELKFFRAISSGGDAV
jgi:hypothetical protein